MGGGRQNLLSYNVFGYRFMKWVQFPDLPFLGVLISLVFSNQGKSLVFRVFSAIFEGFSRAFTGLERGKKSLVFWVVFLGFYINTKEWKIRVFAPEIKMVWVVRRVPAPLGSLRFFCESCS